MSSLHNTSRFAHTADVVPPDYKVLVQDRVNVVEFSPYELSQHLLAVGLKVNIVIYTLRLTDENEKGKYHLEQVRIFHHQSRVSGLSWSPETTLESFPRCLKFACASFDNTVCIIESDLQNDKKLVLQGHKSYVNDVAFEPERGEFLASVSDDHTCRVWNAGGGDAVLVFRLQSPGKRVAWHKDDPGKLLVAEASGVICFYDTANQQPIASVDCGRRPAIAADWATTDALRVVTAAADELFVVDVSKPSAGTTLRAVHEAVDAVRFSRTSERYIATVGRPGSHLKVWNVNTKQAILAGKLPIMASLTWHYRLPIVCVGSNKHVCFWTVPMK